MHEIARPERIPVKETTPEEEPQPLFEKTMFFTKELEKMNAFLEETQETLSNLTGRVSVSKTIRS